MTSRTNRGGTALRHEHVTSEFLDDVVLGLALHAKRIPCKYFYDARGSQLFEEICELDEYYPTRTEIAIMRRYGADMAAAIGPRARIVELGSGSSTKTRLLLDALADPAAYVPVDISREPLLDAAARIAADHPGLVVSPVHADYTKPFALPSAGVRDASQTIVYFPGSTIGNLVAREAALLLRAARAICKPGGALLIGADLKKDPAILHAAYNDARGVTAAFNLNLLERINRELGGDFRVDAFRHHALYDAVAGRIEMHLVSTQSQVVHVGGHTFAFDDGESILTEYSHKYDVQDIARLGAGAFVLERAWVDEQRLFSVQLLRATKA